MVDVLKGQLFAAETGCSIFFFSHIIIQVSSKIKASVLSVIYTIEGLVYYCAQTVKIILEHH